LPDDVESVRAALVGCACRDHAEEIGIDNVDEVFRREAVDRIQKVGASPADELTARFNGKFALMRDGAETAHRDSGTLDGAVVGAETEFAFHLMMGVGAGVRCGVDAQPREHVERVAS
jgi:hypothetical protein